MRVVFASFLMSIFMFSATSFSAVKTTNACGLYAGNRPHDLKLVACVETSYEVNACNFDSARRWWPREMDSRAIFKELLFGEATYCDQMPETFPED